MAALPLEVVTAVYELNVLVATCKPVSVYVVVKTAQPPVLDAEQYAMSPAEV